MALNCSWVFDGTPTTLLNLKPGKLTSPVEAEPGADVTIDGVIARVDQHRQDLRDPK